MSDLYSRDAARASLSAKSSDDQRAMTKAAFESLRAFRRERVASRQLPSQPRQAA